MRLSKALLAIFGLVCLGGPALGWTLRAGPMPGWVGVRSATLWLQADGPGSARIAYWQQDAPQERTLTPPQPLVEVHDFITRFDIAELLPGQTYAYEVLDGDASVSSSGLQFHTQTLWRFRTSPPDFVIALGSCAYVNDEFYDRPGRPYGGGYEIFASIAAEEPAFMLWLGDNVYLREADFPSYGGAAYRYGHTRSLPELQALLQRTHHLAIWDDHDYGPNNTNRAYGLKQESLETFKRYWANPSYGLPEVPGIFTHFVYGDAEFFLLDDRYYRDSDFVRGLPDKRMYGRDQVRWLKNALKMSRARFKFITGGSEMLNRHNRLEGWNHFPEEQSDFLTWLQANEISGVIFLSGDRHYTKLSKRSRPQAYDLYELTCSPLTSNAFQDYEASANPDIDPETLVRERNFCLLSFGGPAKARAVTLSSLDGTGRPLWRRRIEAAALK